MKLEKVRKEIDALDDQIFDALRRRMALIDQVSAAKRASGGKGDILRPGREAMVLRRLLDGHHDVPPGAVVVRLWREIISAACQMQGKLSVAICAPANSVSYWDLARNHFGSTIDMELHRSPHLVLRRVMGEEGVIGILPTPEEGEANPWWYGLTSSPAGGRAPRVIWRLPFIKPQDNRFSKLGAYVVANVQPEATGDDISMILIETDFDMSRASVSARMATLGQDPRIIAISEDAASGSRALLFEVSGFIAEEDKRLTALAGKLGKQLHRLRIIGNYPRPMA